MADKSETGARLPAYPYQWRQRIVDVVIPAIREGVDEITACARADADIKPWHIREACNADASIKALYDQAMHDHARAKAAELLTIHERDDLDAKRMNVASGNIKWYLDRIDPDTFGNRKGDGGADTSDVLATIREAVQRIPRPDASELPAQTIDAEPVEPDEIDLDSVPDRDQDSEAHS